MKSDYARRRLRLSVTLTFLLLSSCGDVLQPDHGTLLPLESAMEVSLIDDYYNMNYPCLLVQTQKLYTNTCYGQLLCTFAIDAADKELTADVYAVQFISPGACGSAMTKSKAVCPLTGVPSGVYTLDLGLHYRNQAPIIDHYQVHYFPPDSMNIYPPCGDSSRVIGGTCP